VFFDPAVAMFMLPHTFALPKPQRPITMAIDWEEFTSRTLTTAEVRLLGTVDIPSMLALQKLAMHEVALQSRACAAVMLCEHPPTITTGSAANLLQLPVDKRELEAKLLQVHRVKRDGGVILHQRGQLAAWVVVSLAECRLDLSEFKQRLQTAALLACTDQRVKATAPDDSSTVQGRHGMLAEIAIGEERGITSFGIFLNVCPRLDEARSFGRGSLGQRISSLDAERVRPTPMMEVRSSLITHICEQIGYPEYHIHTGHPFLKRTRKLVHDKFADTRSDHH
jgi:lipoyl(octanoyl) transferase